MRPCLLALLLSACASHSTPVASAPRANTQVDGPGIEMLTPAARTVVVARLSPPTSASGNGERRIERSTTRD